MCDFYRRRLAESINVNIVLKFGAHACMSGNDYGSARASAERVPRKCVKRSCCSLSGQTGDLYMVAGRFANLYI